MKDKRTGKRRGFGFVVMAAADAKPAIAKLNEKPTVTQIHGERVFIFGTSAASIVTLDSFLANSDKALFMVLMIHSNPTKLAF